jgi:amino acid adenylation domain-containing protein
MTYHELDGLANRMARALADLGVRRGDRVGVWLEKSVRAVAAMQAALRLGATYVPLDPLAPPSRTREIMNDCTMRAIVSTSERAQRILSGDSERMPRLVVDGLEPPSYAEGLASFSGEPIDAPQAEPNDPAYILYTSGSTGKPKGVCISHRNVLAFVEWASEELEVTSDDRLSNHAPLHFDLSVLDLYVAFMTGASVHLIPDGMSFVPGRLVDFITREKITIWYSVPSALILMMENGRLLDLSTIPVRAFLFAGEPFPIQPLRRLFERWPSARFLNLYGPTETNVCTFHEIVEIDADRTKPVPIGRACSGDRVWAVKDDGSRVEPGEEGELMVSGPTVHLGYWGMPPQGDRPYATGDLVRLHEDGEYSYIGRRDHMVKVRGHRIELGDIEAALTEYPGMREVAVVVSGSGVDARLVAYAVNTAAVTPTLLDIKRHCAERLPRYMIIDEARFLQSLPRTRNGKTDRLTLTADTTSRRRNEADR